MVSMGARLFPAPFLKLLPNKRTEQPGAEHRKKIFFCATRRLIIFCSQNNPRLQKALERGLMKSIEDGSFDQWFFQPMAINSRSST